MINKLLTLYNFRYNILEEGFLLLEEVIEKDSVTHYIESCLRYVLSIRNDIGKDELVRIADQISVEGSELVMTIAEQLRQEGIKEGKQEGIKEGKQEGIKEGIKKTAKNAIVKGMETEDIVELTGLTKKEIELIRKEMLQ